MSTCFFVPPYVTRRLPLPDRTADLAHDTTLRQRRAVAPHDPRAVGAAGVVVYDAKHRQATSSRVLCTDVDAGNVTRGLDAAAVLWQPFDVPVFPAVGFAHYGQAYDNAFWDGQQMCFGDGDGQVFGDFTGPVDVCVHERTHGVTGDRLDYADQAGALNESMSDVAGAVARQRTLGLAVTEPTAWLIGYGLMRESGARALRDMLHPGTAYDTPDLGRDPQPGHMADYVHTDEDDGGVHLNSSIPNRAFALAAVELGSTDLLFAVWADVLLHATYPTACTFAQWAQLTVDRSSGPVQQAIARAWSTVGLRVTVPAPEPTPAPAPAPAPVPADPGQGASFRLSTAAADRVALAASRRRPALSAEAELESIVRSHFHMPPT